MRHLFLASVTGGMAKRSAAMYAHGGLMFAFAIGILGVSAAPGQTDESSTADAAVRTCDTTFIGPPGAPWQIVGNWSMGLPRAGDVACIPDQAAAELMALPDSITVRVTDPNRISDQSRVFDQSRDREGADAGARIPSRTDNIGGIPSAPNESGWESRTGGVEMGISTQLISTQLTGVGFGSDPPAVDAVGACCVGTSCVFTDWFDCREMGGYLRRNVVCTGGTCATGVCCTDQPACTDSQDIGQSMDQSLCTIVGGIYVGGAVCGDTDPCQRSRLPAGFEIVQVHAGFDRHNTPHMNNCGEVVYHFGPFFENWTEVFKYDNGILVQLTNNQVPDARPDINDDGLVCFLSGPNHQHELLLLEGQSTRVLAEGDVGTPAISRLGHVVWAKFTIEGCDVSSFKADLWMYDGLVSREVHDDGLSNQIVRINGSDELAWTAYRFPCGGGSWTSEIKFHEDPATALPSVTERPQGPDIDNMPRVAWGSSQGIEVWSSGATTHLIQSNTLGAVLSNRGDVGYNVKTTFTPWQVRVFRDGLSYHISSEQDIVDIVANSNNHINDAGEDRFLTWRLP